MKPIYEKLPVADLQLKSKVIERVLKFDPTEVYNRIKVDVFKRQQNLSVKDMFAIVPGKCSCGCGTELSGKRKKWATDECSKFAGYVFCIITGRADWILTCINRYIDYKCVRCGGNTDLKLDHIIAVMNGGGGCWLNNFQFLCHRCHVEKTKEDFIIRKDRLQKESGNLK